VLFFCFFFFKFRVEIAVEGSIVNSPPDYNSARLSCLNLTLLFACFICSLKISLLRQVVGNLVVYVAQTAHLIRAAP
jgi:hypothetical protein